jgi:hypothetical protein
MRVKVRFAGLVACIGEMKISYKTSVGRPEEKK